MAWGCERGVFEVLKWFHKSIKECIWSIFFGRRWVCINLLTLMMKEVWFLKQIFKSVCIEFVGCMYWICCKNGFCGCFWAKGIFVIAECIDLGAEHLLWKMLQEWSVISTVYRFFKYVFHGKTKMLANCNASLGNLAHIQFVIDKRKMLVNCNASMGNLLNEYLNTLYRS